MAPLLTMAALTLAWLTYCGCTYRRCAKFVTSGGGTVSRIVKLVALSPEAEAGGGGGGGGEEFDYAEVRREAHSMKGAASTIGAMQLSQAALEL